LVLFVKHVRICWCVKSTNVANESNLALRVMASVYLLYLTIGWFGGNSEAANFFASPTLSSFIPILQNPSGW
jgi:hypothetical protein